MKLLYPGFYLFTLIASELCEAFREKRFSGNGQTGEWNYNRGGQASNNQPMSVSQTSWPGNKGDTAINQARPPSKTNRDGPWKADGWTSQRDGRQDNKGDSFDMGWTNQQPQGNNKGSAYPDEGDDAPGDLEVLLRGVPGMDFPNFSTVPNTDFDCSQMPSQGYYGDVEAGCQVFHICQPGNRKDSFLCPVGTIFNQKYFVCDWWFNVNCSETQSLYELNNDIYKEAVAVTDAPIPSTTEKMLPWSSQDLDRKRPPKGWTADGSVGKLNPASKDVASKRGGKSFAGSAAKSWSQTDVQKEVTLSWSTSGNYGSSSFSSNSMTPTSKPIWYGIDGQPARDQSDPVRKRNGLVHTSAPFGARMKASSSVATAGTWKPTEDYQMTTTANKKNAQTSSTTRGWQNHPQTSIVPSTVEGVWEQDSTRPVDQNIETYSKPEKDSTSNFFTGFPQGHKRQALVDNKNSESQESSVTVPIETKSSFLGSTTTATLGDWLPETAIVPSGVKGVWEQETMKESAYNMLPSVVGSRGIVIKASANSPKESKFKSSTTQKKTWDQRRLVRKSPKKMAASTTSVRKLKKKLVRNSRRNNRKSLSSNFNSVPKKQFW